MIENYAFSAFSALSSWALGRAFVLQKSLSDEVLLWKFVWSKVQMICVWSS